MVSTGRFLSLLMHSRTQAHVVSFNLSHHKPYYF